jgi:hypothetical protein
MTLEEAGTPRGAGISFEEACAALGRLFYDLVRLDDGSVGFVRNTLDAQLDEIFAKALDEIFGPEPAEDD